MEPLNHPRTAHASPVMPCVLAGHARTQSQAMIVARAHFRRPSSLQVASLTSAGRISLDFRCSARPPAAHFNLKDGPGCRDCMGGQSGGLAARSGCAASPSVLCRPCARHRALNESVAYLFHVSSSLNPAPKGGGAEAPLTTSPPHGEKSLDQNSGLNARRRGAAAAVRYPRARFCRR